MNQYDYEERDLDDEERYGELQEYIDDVGEAYTLNPITGARNYKDGE